MVFVRIVPLMILSVVFHFLIVVRFVVPLMVSYYVGSTVYWCGLLFHCMYMLV